MTTLDQFIRDSVRRELIITLEWSLFPSGRPIMRLATPGATSRSKPVNILPWDYIVGDPGETWVKLLRSLAGAIELVDKDGDDPDGAGSAD